MFTKIISGGQTGADRAALDSALEQGFPCGGSCPKGRLAEDGPIDPKYPLVEIDGGYVERTQKNVEDSDGTVIFYHCHPQGGTEQTIAFCIIARKPYKLIDMDTVLPGTAVEKIITFISAHQIQVLNVAGPRLSQCPMIYSYARQIMDQVIQVMMEQSAGSPPPQS